MRSSNAWPTKSTSARESLAKTPRAQGGNNNLGDRVVSSADETGRRLAVTPQSVTGRTPIGLTNIVPDPSGRSEEFLLPDGDNRDREDGTSRVRLPSAPISNYRDSSLERKAENTRRGEGDLPMHQGLVNLQVHTNQLWVML